jgi:3-dehydroquinate synthase
VRYTITEVPDLLSSSTLRTLAPVQHVIFDQGAQPWEAALRAHFEANGVSHTWHEISGGEACKTRSEVDRLESELLSVAGRRDLITAVGGGAVLDVARVTASRVLKGLPLALVPTTATGYADTAAGIKGAVNVDGRKNASGCYYSPVAVLLHRGLLSTISEECAAAGLMELLKMGLITGGRLFSRIEAAGLRMVGSRFQCPEAIPVLRDGITAMVSRLAPNFFEWSLIRDVDLGHGLSFLETEGDVPHGLAVGVNLALDAAYSHAFGLLPETSMNRIHAIIRKTAMLYHPLVTAERVHEAMKRAATQRGGTVNLPVIHDIGHVVVHPTVDDAVMARAIDTLGATAGQDT